MPDSINVRIRVTIYPLGEVRFNRESRCATAAPRTTGRPVASDETTLKHTLPVVFARIDLEIIAGNAIDTATVEKTRKIHYSDNEN